MIVKMRKVFVAARNTDRDRLLDVLRDLGVMHLEPVDPGKAVPPAQTLGDIDHLGRAIQLLSAVEPEGKKPDLSPVEAGEEVLEIQRSAAEGRSRLQELHRQIEQLEMWGDVRTEQFEQLRSNGLEIRFYSVRADQIGEFRGDLVQVITELPRNRRLVAVVIREGSPEIETPDNPTPIALPDRDRPAIRREAAQIDRAIKQGVRRKAQLAHLLEEMIRAREDLRACADYTVARGSGLAGENLFAIQGWIPAEQAQTLPDEITAAGIDGGVDIHEPSEDDNPPTLIEYPRWARPIKGLFDILGTLPGYKEIDLAPFFMIALPVFAAMLIGDAGYGLIFLLVPLVLYRKAVAKAGKVQVHLLMVLGGATILWGVLSGNVFGVSPGDLMDTGGFLGTAGNALDRLQVIRGDMTQQAQMIMKLSFIFAAVHLSLAQLRAALVFAPNLRALGRIGWAVFLWGIFCIIWYLFFGSRETPPHPPHRFTPWLLSIGAGMAILFANPSRNPLKALGVGVAWFPLSALGTFSDSISYIRLMGVGLASTIIARTFNSLGADVAGAASWFVGAFVVILGHALNIAMCMIAVLAHGVRLNMLEFSNNAGVQWAGYPYRPFAAAETKET